MSYLASRFLETHVRGLRARFGLRAVLPEALLAGPAARAAVVKQVHGTTVLPVEAAFDGDRLRATEADAMITGARGLGLAVRTADCVPLLLADADGLGCAAVHAGWRGTVQGVVRTAVAALMERTRAPSGALFADVGPSIGPCCFEVGEEVAAHFQPDEVVRSGAARPHVDLGRAVRRELLAAGLHAEHIGPWATGDAVPCTCCETQRFASYRRATRAGQPLEAHQFSLIMLGAA